MNYEVVVVGGGIGGLTTAALLAARGVNVCLFERQSSLGGCVANFAHLGYTFEPTLGLYLGWEPGGIYEKLFSELPVSAPEVQRLSPAYSVRLPDRTELEVSDDLARFEENLRLAFPECPLAAVEFYRKLALKAAVETNVESSADTTAAHLTDSSERFRRFIDVQLQTFTQCASDQCSFNLAAHALTAPLRGMWAIRGGAQALVDALGDSLKKSGGTLRLDSPVLRLAYGADSAPIGVDLLSGERVLATRAIVSNLTVWDTYGKLIGLGRTPPTVAAQLRNLSAWGSYLLFLGMDDQNPAARVKPSRLFVLTDWQTDQFYEPDQAQFVFAAAPDWDLRAPEGKRAVTVSMFTRAEDWFSFHEDESAHEEQDQSTLESLLSRLHSAMPELGDSVEVIESATPRTFYDNTRRKLGMVGRPRFYPEFPAAQGQFGKTIFPNVFLVGDTVCSGLGIAGVSQAASILADLLSGRVS
jgi:phytoene dehydrogenase-like protein